MAVIVMMRHVKVIVKYPGWGMIVASVMEMLGRRFEKGVKKGQASRDVYEHSHFPP